MTLRLRVSITLPEHAMTCPFSRHHAIALAVLAWTASANAAPQAATDPVQDAKTADPIVAGCIDIEVNGERIPDYDCLSRALASPPGQEPGYPPSLPGSEEIARRPPTRLGLVTPEATRQRMGNTFGKSTLPQRPEPPPPPTLPPAIRRP